MYDKSLLLPEGLEYDLPLVLDLSIHLIPTIVCWIDLLVYNKDFKRSPTHILAIYIFGLSYFYWANLCFENNGYWVYPLLGKFSDMQRAVFFLFCSWGGALIYKSSKLITCAYVCVELELTKMGFFFNSCQSAFFNTRTYRSKANARGEEDTIK